MRFTPLAVDGAFVVSLEPRLDERGFFARAWCADEMAAHGVDGRIAQMNLSQNLAAGTIRGLHVQHPPHGESKYFRCIAGRSHHVVLDLRPQSPTYGRTATATLDTVDNAALVVPMYCATGYQALDAGTTVLYSVSSPYEPGAETGVRWDDPALGIEWPVPDPILSAKDQSWPDLQFDRSTT